MDDVVIDILENLAIIHEDTTVPKNIRTKIKNAISILEDNEKNISIKIDKSLQELSDIADDPNLPTYTRMQIWSMVSQLESS